MITVCKISDVHRGEYDRVYCIMRYFHGGCNWIIHNPSLAPSSKIFSAYRRAKEEGRWDEDYFKSNYVGAFLQEMLSDEARVALQYHAAEGDKKNIALVCCCPDESMCHRSIIAGLLKGMGADVRTESGRDYLEYYQQYLRMGGVL